MNSMSTNLTGQIREISYVTTAVAREALSKKITGNMKGEVLELKSTVNNMVDFLDLFAGEVARVSREMKEGKLGSQVDLQSLEVEGIWKGKHHDRSYDEQNVVLRSKE